MKRIRLLLLSLLCVLLFSGCVYHRSVEGHTSATLIDNWEDLVKRRLASLTPLGSPEQVIPLGTPEPCTFDFENRLYGYCGKADVGSHIAKRYFISDTNVVWIIGLDGLSTLPEYPEQPVDYQRRVGAPNLK